MSEKVVISGITSFRNHGVEALVVSTIEQLRQRLTKPSFTVLDRSPDYDRHQLLSDDVNFAQDHSIRSLYASRARRAINRLAPQADKLAKETIREIRSADLVMASGGDVFCSEYGHRSLLSHLTPLRIAQEARVPTVLHAQSIGPFSNAADRHAFCAIAKRASAITVREHASYRYLTETLNLPSKQCHLVADPAFLLRQPSQAEGNQLFGHLQHRTDRPTIALGISQAICHWMEADNKRHLDTWLEIIGWLRTTLDANVILIPHVQEISPDNDDRVLATNLMRRLGHDPAVRLAGGDFTAHDFKAIIARCDLVIAERMHAAIAGLSTTVPTLVVGYSIKAEGILTDMYGEELTKTALVSIQDFLTPQRGLSQVQATWDDRDTLRRRLLDRLPKTKQLAGKAFDVLQQTFKQHTEDPVEAGARPLAQSPSFG